MKKIIMIMIVCALIVCILSSCTDSKIDISPSIEQVKSICELSTVESYYNNVAKMTIKKGKGLTHIGEKDREIWIEYEGYAKLGIEFADVSMKIKGDKIKIHIPKAKILEMGILNINEDSYYISEDGWFNKNKIDTEKQQEAVANAQNEMITSIQNNRLLFEQAENKAKDLIENYINKLGDLSGIEYQIEWITE